MSEQELTILAAELGAGEERLAAQATEDSDAREAETLAAIAEWMR